MIRLLDVKPVSPKNGDRYRNASKQIFEFRYGTWVEISKNREKL